MNLNNNPTANTHQPNNPAQVAILNLHNDTFGKIPPQAPELEEAVLGAIMLSKDALIEAVEILQDKHFYLEVHQHIFKAITDLHSKNNPVDILTVTEQLKTNGVLELAGGPYKIAQLTSRVSSSANIVYHSRIVLQKAIARELITGCGEAIRDLYDDQIDVFKIRDDIQNKIDVVSKPHTGSLKTLKEATDAAVKDIKKLKDNPIEFIGLDTGYEKLNKITGGWQRSDLIVIACVPGLGKTSFMMNTAVRAAMKRKRLLVFSLEMDTRQLAMRVITMESEVELPDLRNGRVTDADMERINLIPGFEYTEYIKIDDTPSLSIPEIRNRAKALIRKWGLDGIFADYLQLATGSKGKNQTRDAEITEISYGLKNLAKELNIPIIALCQLNREVMKRGNPRPRLSDLRESGGIEQAADIVLFLYLEEETDNSVVDVIFQFEKHRNGPTGFVVLRNNKKSLTFT